MLICFPDANGSDKMTKELVIEKRLRHPKGGVQVCSYALLPLNYQEQILTHNSPFLHFVILIIALYRCEAVFINNHHYFYLKVQ